MAAAKSRARDAGAKPHRMVALPLSECSAAEPILSGFLARKAALLLSSVPVACGCTLSVRNAPLSALMPPLLVTTPLGLRLGTRRAPLCTLLPLLLLKVLDDDMMRCGAEDAMPPPPGAATALPKSATAAVAATLDRSATLSGAAATAVGCCTCVRRRHDLLGVLVRSGMGFLEAANCDNDAIPSRERDAPGAARSPPTWAASRSGVAGLMNRTSSSSPGTCPRARHDESSSRHTTPRLTGVHSTDECATAGTAGVTTAAVAAEEGRPSSPELDAAVDDASAAARAERDCDLRLCADCADAGRVASALDAAASCCCCCTLLLCSTATCAWMFAVRWLKTEAVFLAGAGDASCLLDASVDSLLEEAKALELTGTTAAVLLAAATELGAGATAVQLDRACCSGLGAADCADSLARARAGSSDAERCD